MRLNKKADAVRMQQLCWRTLPPRQLQWTRCEQEADGKGEKEGPEVVRSGRG
jgi:hypothetical protein